ncbi:MAG TPA: lasso peptide biosynthesis B2 protein [Candidatus Sulfotelmatobacter sp.]|nr:lasso peptide biosynthesis B2 protein [Candidatus Sulfotelmatobacter sp.]
MDRMIVSSPSLRLFSVRSAAPRAKISWMSQPFRQVLRLSSDQKWLLLRAVFILPMTYAGLELLGFQRLLSCIQHFTRVDQKRRVLEELSSYPQILSALARRCPLPMKCLGRSVALYWLLRLEGIDATVHIGVRKDQHDIDAHAWVQCGDRIINDSEDVADRYVRIVPSFPAI